MALQTFGIVYLQKLSVHQNETLKTDLTRMAATLKRTIYEPTSGV